LLRRWDSYDLELWNPRATAALSALFCAAGEIQSISWLESDNWPTYALLQS
jgi:hypothetical protein